jgi:hypothetical protein
LANPFDDEGPPPNWEQFAESERRLRSQAVAELEDLIRLIGKWLEMPQGMRSRDPFWTGAYIHGTATKLLATLNEIAQEHASAELGIDSCYSDIELMLIDEDSEKWPEGVSADHVYELSAYLRHLRPPESATPDTQPPDDEEALASTQEFILVAVIELRAFDAESACPIKKIVAQAGVAKRSSRNVRDAMARLKTRRLLKSRPGPSGGTWITLEGRRVIERKTLSKPAPE